MSARGHLRVVDREGNVSDPADAEETIYALQAALSRAQKTIDGLKGQLAENRSKARATHPIDDAFEDWKAKVVAAGFKGKARCKLSDDRIDAMNSMFEKGYTLEDFRLANTGLAEFPYVVYGKRRQSGSKDALDNDIGWACEKARRFEEAARLGFVVEHNRAAS